MALEASNVTRQFLRKRGSGNVFNAVDDVSLKLENGKITVITGPSGSGKSTLLNMMAGILAPTKGTIAIDGSDLYSMNDNDLSAFRNEHIGVVPQGQTAIYSLTAMDNVLLPYTLYCGKKKKTKNSKALTKGNSDPIGDDKDGTARTDHKETAENSGPETAETPKSAGNNQGSASWNEETIRKRAEELLEKTGIKDLAEVMPSEMSGGELRRMTIARAMLLKPDVILADEPTADLDEENTKIVLSLMRYAAEEGSAVMIVTHDKDVFPWADQVFSLREGKLSE